MSIKKQATKTGNSILLITMDQLSLHALSCYDAYLCETPSIDSLTEDGIQFVRNYTPCALCTPARASILSGQYPHNHGALHNSGIMIPLDENEIGNRLQLFPEVLKKKGYNLGYQGKWHAGVAPTANDVGFEGFGPADYGHYKESPAFDSYLSENNLKPVDEVIEFFAQSEDNWMDSSGYTRGDIRATGSYFLTEETIDQIKNFSHQDKPFFHWLSFWGPHAPYWPHESYLDLYPAEKVRKWASFEEPWDKKPLTYRRFRESIMPLATAADWSEWSRIISRYYAQTRMIDDQIGRLIKSLKEQGIYNDLTIVFTADHGDSLGIHGGIFDKGPMSFEQIYNIPLIIKLPKQEQAGKKIDSYVSLLDLAPTFCALANGNLNNTDGRSLLPLLEGEKSRGRDDFLAEFHGHRFPVGQRILWWNDYKYILNFADQDEMYYV
jgi:arylsulfatase A-like enzyme